MTGWVKINRSIASHWVFEDPEKLKAWLIILFQVNHKKKKTLIGNNLFEIERGESLNSLDTWAELFGENWNKSRVRRFFKVLESDSMIETKNEVKTTRLKVCNYDSYQDERNASETQVKRKRNASETQVKRKRNASETQVTPNKNDKKEKNDNNEEERKEREELNISFEDLQSSSSEINQSELFALEKKEEEEKKKSSAKKRKEEISPECRDYFLNYYKKEKGVDYYWGVADAVALNQLIQKLRAISGNAKDETVLDLFFTFLGKLKAADEWVYDNLSLRILNQKFNELVPKMKRVGADGRKSNMPPSYEAMFEKFYKKIYKDD